MTGTSGIAEKTGDARSRIVETDDGRRSVSPELTSLQEYPGAKGGAGVWQTIINQFPPHETYIEAFLGSGVVMRQKKRAMASIGIDADEAVCASWSLSAGLTVICADAISWLAAYPWRGDEVLYCDPPYLLSVRSQQRDYYRCEFATEEQHRSLLSLLLTIGSSIVISGYWCPLYAAMLQRWRTVEIPTVNRAGQRVTEWLWCNFPEPFALHDYRFLGRNFRERERIKRKKQRWKSKLKRMPMLERAAVLAAIDDARCSSEMPMRTVAPETAMRSLENPVPLSLSKSHNSDRP